MKSLLLSLCFLLQISAPHAGAAVCPMVKIEAERLPDLNIPRSGHGFLFVNGQPTVMGGHTSGFVPTSTIEYFSDGQWHVVPTVYPHDAGGSLLLKSGKVLLFGSHEKNLGIGQTFEVEMYNPADHTSEGFGCLDRKRVMPSAVETDSGKVIIAGNWYDDDAIEMFDGKSQFTVVKPVAVGRARPYMLPISNGDVLIFGDCDTRGNVITSALVDRLFGDAFNVPLFERWKPYPTDAISPRAEDCFIGDLQKRDTAYLISVADRNTGQVAIAQVRDTIFSLLPTEVPVPMETEWGSIYYCTSIVTDRQAKRAYIAGIDEGMHLCILSIEYEKSPCPLTLYYTDTMPHLGLTHLRLTPAGNLLIAGGANGIDNNNFTPSNQVWLVPLASSKDFHNAATASCFWWVAALVLVLTAIVVVLLLRHHHSKELPEIEESDKATDEGDDAPLAFERSEVPPAPERSEELMLRLRQLMDEQKPYLNSELKLQDFADMLGTNRTYILDDLKAACGQTFTQFVNAYRVEYAKQLLVQHPDRKMSAVSAESGFATESSFFRIFKAATGVTPRDWRGQETDETTTNPQID